LKLWGEDSDAVAAAEEALSKLSPSTAAALLKKATASSTSTQGGASKGSQPVTPTKQSSGQRRDSMEVKDYYKRKLEQVNTSRKNRRIGPINKASSRQLFEGAAVHAGKEEAFAGTGLGPPAWFTPFTDGTLHPAADAEETDSDE